MTKSVKTNVKSIAKNSVAAPVEVAAVAVELTADTMSLATKAIGGAIPTTKRLGNIVGMFVTGMFNSEIDENEAKKLYKETSLETVFNSIEQASLRAGQDLVKAWEETDVTTTKTEKQE